MADQLTAGVSVYENAPNDLLFALYCVGLLVNYSEAITISKWLFIVGARLDSNAFSVISK